MTPPSPTSGSSMLDYGLQSPKSSNLNEYDFDAAFGFEESLSQDRCLQQHQQPQSKQQRRFVRRLAMATQNVLHLPKLREDLNSSNNVLTSPPIPPPQFPSSSSISTNSFASIPPHLTNAGKAANISLSANVSTASLGSTASTDDSGQVSTLKRWSESLKRRVSTSGSAAVLGTRGSGGSAVKLEGGYSQLGDESNAVATYASGSKQCDCNEDGEDGEDEISKYFETASKAIESLTWS